MIEFAELRYTSDDVHMFIGRDEQLKEEYVKIYKEWEDNCILSPNEREFIYNVLMLCIDRLNDKTINNDVVLCLFKSSINSVMDELRHRLAHSLVFNASVPIFGPFNNSITFGCLNMFIQILILDDHPYKYSTVLDLFLGINSDYIFRNKSKICKLCDNITNEQRDSVDKNIHSLLENIQINSLYKYHKYDIDKMNITKAIDDISKIDVSIVEAYDIGLSNIVEIAGNYMTGRDKEESLNELNKILSLVNDNRELFKSVNMIYILLNTYNYSNLIK